MKKTIETRDDLGRVHFENEIFDSLSHFFDYPDRYRVIDKWGKTGTAIGYRSWIDGIYPDSGFGGEIWVLYDHDHSIGGVDPRMLENI